MENKEFKFLKEQFKRDKDNYPGSFFDDRYDLGTEDFIIKLNPLSVEESKDKNKKYKAIKTNNAWGGINGKNAKRNSYVSLNCHASKDKEGNFLVKFVARGKFSWDYYKLGINAFIESFPGKEMNVIIANRSSDKAPFRIEEEESGSKIIVILDYFDIDFCDNNFNEEFDKYGMMILEQEGHYNILQ